MPHLDSTRLTGGWEGGGADEGINNQQTHSRRAPRVRAGEATLGLTTLRRTDVRERWGWWRTDGGWLHRRRLPRDTQCDKEKTFRSQDDDDDDFYDDRVVWGEVNASWRDVCT